MTRDQKLAVHLEMIIWLDLPEGTKLNAFDVKQLMAISTPSQRARAKARALIMSPMLVEDERL